MTFAPLGAIALDAAVGAIPVVGSFPSAPPARPARI